MPTRDGSRVRVGRNGGAQIEARRRAGMEQAARRMLLYGVMPVWIVDWRKLTDQELFEFNGEGEYHALMSPDDL